MITTRTLSSEADLARFCDGYAAAYAAKRLRSLHPPRVEDLARYDHVVGVFRAGSMIAGFVVNRYPHRCLAAIDAAGRREIEARLGGAEHMSELAAIWKSPEVDSQFFTTRVWPKIVHDAWKRGRRYIFGCVYQGHGMSKAYLALRPTIIREGRHENDLTVFYYTRGSLLVTFFLGLMKGMLKCARS